MIEFDMLSTAKIYTESELLPDWIQRKPSLSIWTFIQSFRSIWRITGVRVTNHRILFSPDQRQGWRTCHQLGSDLAFHTPSHWPHRKALRIFLIPFCITSSHRSFFLTLSFHHTVEANVFSPSATWAFLASSGNTQPLLTRTRWSKNRVKLFSLRN